VISNKKFDFAQTHREKSRLIFKPDLVNFMAFGINLCITALRFNGMLKTNKGPKYEKMDNCIFYGVIVGHPVLLGIGWQKNN
jgi:hypothetical protein